MRGREREGVDAVVSTNFGDEAVGGRGLSWVVRSGEDVCGALYEVVVEKVAGGVADAEDAVVVASGGCGSRNGDRVEVEALHATSQGFVGVFLRTAPFELFVVCTRLVEGRAVVGELVTNLRDVDVVETVGFNGGIIEPRTIAALPLGPTDHAEFGQAAARHVVAAFLQLNGRGAVVAALPALLLGHFDEFEGRFVLGAFLR